MQYFSQEYFSFFDELKKNNNHEWFERNRDRFEKHVRVPFINFTNEMIRRIQRYEPSLELKGSEAVFRIDKDGKGKVDHPYRNHMSAMIACGGRRSKDPAFYFQFGCDQCLVGGGLFMVSREELPMIRSAIAWHGNEFGHLLSDKTFCSKYGALQGEKNKKLPPDLKEAFSKQPLIANKQFYYTSVTPCELILNQSLPDILMEFYKAGKPVNEFLRRAMKVSV
jgi:uncharacterized protein (TIGR02453 family)